MYKCLVHVKGRDQLGHPLLCLGVGRGQVPFAVVLEEPAIAQAAARVPWLRGKKARDGQVTAYVCEEGICELPTTDPAVFSRQLQGEEAE